MTSLTEHLRRGLAHFRHLPWLVRLVWSAAPRWTAVWGVLLLAQGLLPVATVYATRQAVNGLTRGEDLAGQLAGIFVLGGLLALQEALRSVTQWVRAAQSEHVQDRMRDLVLEASMSADLASVESAAYRDRLYRVSWDSAQRGVAVLETLGGIAQRSLTLAAMLVVILPFGFWLPVALLVSVLPAVWLVLRYAAQRHAWWLRATPRTRRVQYYHWLLTGAAAAVELRTLTLGAYWKGRHDALRDSLRSERIDMERRRALLELGAGAAGMAVLGGTVLWVALRTLRGGGTLGDLALFLHAFLQGQGVARLLLQSVGELFSNALFISTLREYLGLRPTILAPPAPVPVPATLREGVTCDGVTFRYPGATHDCLRNLTLAFPPQGLVAILGANGSGKTTLLKLLCRLYDPQAGAIRIDGVDLRAADPAQLRRRLAVMPQEAMAFSETVAESVALGDVEAPRTPDRLHAAARSADAESLIAALPAGYDTPLGREYDATGVELSVGEWQRIALARACYRDAPILLLDEPTSAMDPWVEREWLGRLAAIARDRLVVVVTHRPHTAARADRILVMEHGTVVEEGSHDTLVAAGNRYAALWQRDREALAPRPDAP